MSETCWRIEREVEDLEAADHRSEDELGHRIVLELEHTVDKTEERALEPSHESKPVGGLARCVFLQRRFDYDFHDGSISNLIIVHFHEHDIIIIYT